jgi:lysophospholipase L1-like esterase
MRLDGNLRYVALGDSQTEGIGDGDEESGYRGWADRFAQRLAATGARVDYANLAVRGRLAREVHEGQLKAALELRPDVATVFAGVNDLIRPRYDADAVLDHLETMFAELTGVGARVATITFPNIAEIAPLVKPLVPRVLDFNERLREAAERHGVAVADTAAYGVATDPRLWQSDRLHCSPEGHRRIAGAVAHALGIPGSDETWADPLPPVPAPGRLRSAAAEVRWLGSFLGPWVVRRVRGRSSGDGRTAKRPAPLPVEL